MITKTENQNKKKSFPVDETPFSEGAITRIYYIHCSVAQLLVAPRAFHLLERHLPVAFFAPFFREAQATFCYKGE